MIASAKKALIKELGIKLADEEKIKPELEILAGEVVKRINKINKFYSWRAEALQVEKKI